MKGKNLFFSVLFVIILIAESLFADGTQPSGSGTETDPYLIENSDNLLWLSTNSSVWDQNYYFKQTADIDASTISNLTPIGDDDKKFNGTYLGNNHFIEGLELSIYSSNIGFFGETNGADIKNLEIKNANIRGSYTVGGLIGLAEYSTITDCSSSGSITATEYYCGGLIGISNSSTISNSSSSCSVDANYYAGGLIGVAQLSSHIKQCFATGNVEANNNCGGLIGEFHGLDMINSYSRGTVTRKSGSTSTHIASFIGYLQSAEIENCYSTGNVIYADAANPTNKGFVVEGTEESTFSNNFFDSESSAQTTGAGATPKTTAEMKTESTFTDAGWDFVGETENGLKDYWEMSDAKETSYPILAWQSGKGSAPSGNGTEADPYLIANLDNLLWLSTNNNVWDQNYYFKQIADIDASITSNLTPIGDDDKKFNGTYLGNNHFIEGLEISIYSSNIGFFGETDGADIKNLEIKNANIRGSYTVGGLIGLAEYSTITDCSSSGGITATENYCGGLIGISNSSTISNSSSSCSVDANYYAGGLIGVAQLSSHIKQCSAIGNVEANNNCGGFIGEFHGRDMINSYSRGTVTRKSGSTSTNIASFIGYLQSAEIENCYSTGNVIYADVANPTNKGFVVEGTEESTFSNNFFDSESSAQTTGAGATAKTTAEMKTQSTFTDAGWDFVGETENGTDDYWKMSNTKETGYPILSWQEDNETLPVELSSFTAIQTESNLAQLNWVTQSETDLLGYNIYRNINDEENSRIKINSVIIAAENSSNENNYTFTDKNVEMSNIYYYWLESVDLDGSSQFFGPVNITLGSDDPQNPDAPEIPINPGIQKIYPNPFNPQTTISYYLDKDTDVIIKIYNAKGQKVNEFNQGVQEGQTMHSLVWNGKNSNSENVSSGVYFFKLNAGKIHQIKKAILLK